MRKIIIKNLIGYKLISYTIASLLSTLIMIMSIMSMHYGNIIQMFTLLILSALIQIFEYRSKYTNFLYRPLWYSFSKFSMFLFKVFITISLLISVLINFKMGLIFINISLLYLIFVELYFILKPITYEEIGSDDINKYYIGRKILNSSNRNLSESEFCDWMMVRKKLIEEKDNTKEKYK